jgi:hypothetical protein
MTYDKSDFHVLNNGAIFVAGVGVFPINDPKLHKLYPNFTTSEQMLKEIKELGARPINVLPTNFLEKLLSL